MNNTLRRYILKSEKSPNQFIEGWAIIVIDTSNGFFSAVSDFGNYSYLWSNPGCEFRKFLMDCNADYFHGKIMMGRPDRKVFDDEATLRAVKDYLSSDLNIHTDLKPRELRLLERYSFEDEEEFKEWMEETTIDHPWELIQMRPEPQSWQFCTLILPRFQAMLKKELKEEGNEGNE